MPTQLKRLSAEMLKLSRTEREKLAQELIASLDEDHDIDAAWAAEIEKRVAEIESGAVAGVPLAEALALARAALK